MYGEMLYGRHTSLTPVVVKINMIQNGMTLARNELTHKTENNYSVKYSGPDWLVSTIYASSLILI